MAFVNLLSTYQKDIYLPFEYVRYLSHLFTAENEENKKQLKL